MNWVNKFKCVDWVAYRPVKFKRQHVSFAACLEPFRTWLTRFF